MRFCIFGMFSPRPVAAWPEDGGRGSSQGSSKVTLCTCPTPASILGQIPDPSREQASVYLLTPQDPNNHWWGCRCLRVLPCLPGEAKRLSRQDFS